MSFNGKIQSLSSDFCGKYNDEPVDIDPIKLIKKEKQIK